MWKRILALTLPCAIPAVVLIAQGAAQPSGSPQSTSPAAPLPLPPFVLEPRLVPGTETRTTADVPDDAWAATAALLLVPDAVVDFLLPRIEPAFDDVDETIQDEELVTPESILDEIDPVLVIASNAAPRHTAAGGLLRAIVSPFAVVSAASPQEQPPLRMLVTSLGGATGDVFSVQFLNQGPTPITLPRSSMTLRPLEKRAAERAMKEFARLRGRLTTARMFGYCLNYRKRTPPPGTIYALAPKDAQDRHASVRDVLASVSALSRRKLIQPEGDPKAYFHSLRQWAIWTREQKFGQQSFTTALLDRAKQNLADAKRPWTKEVDAFVRGSAKKRWTDVTRVLRVAETVAEKRARAGGGR